MKKLLILIVIFASGCAPKPTVTSITVLPTHQCLYEVSKLDTTYTFIDDCGKYPIGFKVE